MSIQPETAILQAIRLSVGARPDARIFRNNVGKYQDRDGRLITYGLAPGSADLIGWRTVTIRPHHVGRTIAVFTALEVKTATGRTSPAQDTFLAAVHHAGGISAVVRDPAAANRILDALV